MCTFNKNLVLRLCKFLAQTYVIGIVFLGIISFDVLAQESVNSSGGTIQGSGGSVSYSVGQIVYSTNTGTEGAVAQGVQQPYEISIITQVPEAENIDLQCVVYPNPANDYLRIKIENTDFENLYYQFYDIHGRLLLEKQITDKETIITIGHYSVSVYFLKIFSHGKELKQYKIIKNH